MERFDVTNLRLLKHGSISFSLFWIITLGAQFGLYELNTLILIIAFLLLAFSLLGLTRWQKGNKITLTDTELIIRDYYEGIYYSESSEMLTQSTFSLKHIKKIIISNPKDLQELAQSTGNESLLNQVAFPREADQNKLATLILMYVQNKDGEFHVTNISPFRQKSITKLLNKLSKYKLEIIDKR